MHKMRTLFLTFDDGPIARDYWRRGNPASDAELLKPLNSILKVLAKKKIQGLFFLTGWGDFKTNENSLYRGEKAVQRAFEEGVRRIQDEGHLLGLHAFTHSIYLKSRLKDDEILSDIRQLMEVTPALASSMTYWRTPYGRYRQAQLRLAALLNLVPRNWEVDSMDWTYHDDAYVINWLFSNYSAWKKMVKTSLSRSIRKFMTRPNDLGDVMFHVNLRTAESLESLIDLIQNEAKIYANVMNWGESHKLN